MQTISVNAGNFFLWFGNKSGRGKITIGTDEDGSHYTLLIDEVKRVINIHKTYEGKNRPKKYEQIFEMSFFTFRRFIVLYKRTDLNLLEKYWLAKRINIGKLKRHDTILFPMVEDEGFAKNFVDIRRSRKIKLRREIPLEPLLTIQKFPDEIPDCKESVFWVWSTRRGRMRNQGLIFRHPLDKRERSYFFLTKKNFARYQRDSAITLFNVLKQLDFKYKNTVIGYMHQTLEERFPKNLSN